MNARLPVYACVVMWLIHASPCPADSVVIDRIYHPYVQPMEQELEWRGIFQNHQPSAPDDLQLHRFAYGRSINQHWFVDFYLVGEQSNDSDFDLKSYELEALRQLTEQGEFWADWGLLFELEKEANEDAWSFSTGVLIEKEWGQWSSTANLFLVHGWGSDASNDWESRLGLQLRYRYSRAFEPALEFYGGKDTRGFGPVMLGQFSVGKKNSLNWEAGIIFGLDNKSPDRTLRFSLEFEF
ncbi:hypothetical protein ACFL0N_03940 [Pseudomonadota bacterium]